jgi:hypothetical protein
MQWEWEHFLQPIKAGDVTFDEIADPEIMAAISHRHMLESRERDLVQVRALLSAGWKYELPEGHNDAEPMSWYWRAPPKRIGAKGRRTNQAHNAMLKEAK